MLASPAEHVPTGPEWVHEVKWDGMRVLADVRDGVLRLMSRTERDVTAAFPELAPLAETYPDMLLDGEVVVLRDGIPNFGALAERFGIKAAAARTLARTAPVTYFAFDLLRLYGVDLTGRSFADRRATLERLELDGPRWHVPATFTDGAALLAATREQGLEGVVSKRLASRYAVDTRSPDWVKVPHRASRSVVIGGWRPETTSRRLGALLVGVPGPGGLRYLGRVGSGLAGKAGALVATHLAGLASPTNPFLGDLPAEDVHGTTWVHPILVADVTSLGFSSQGRLRQPAYKGLRPDLTAGDVPTGDGPIGDRDLSGGTDGP